MSGDELRLKVAVLETRLENIEESLIALNHLQTMVGKLDKRFGELSTEWKMWKWLLSIMIPVSTLVLQILLKALNIL